LHGLRPLGTEAEKRAKGGEGFALERNYRAWGPLLASNPAKGHVERGPGSGAESKPHRQPGVRYPSLGREEGGCFFLGHQEAREHTDNNVIRTTEGAGDTRKRGWCDQGRKKNTTKTMDSEHNDSGRKYGAKRRPKRANEGARRRNQSTHYLNGTAEGGGGKKQACGKIVREGGDIQNKAIL